MPNRIYRLQEVQERTGLGRSTIYRLEAKGEFPARIKLSERAVGWHSAAIDSWIESRISDAA
ncbi:hypothetical protein ATO2_18365 [Roseovarius sp. 22II1-1F6A]|nr:hypothetical protein ATO2_18365 [Roseovarius sp. 22II1-1F6A]